MKFFDRSDAGRRLAKLFEQYVGQPDIVVLALPRGGVPVAFEVADYLNAPLDIMLVRKVGVPGHRELALGAIASGDVMIMNESIVTGLGISEAEIAPVVEQEKRELERREQLYRGDLPASEIAAKTVIIVDDGIATGATMRAAVAAVQQQQPKRVLVGAPTAARDSCEVIRNEVDELVCVDIPEPYIAVGCWYRNFDQTTDEEVRSLLHKARQRAG